jgi:hypothetical protein
MSEQDAWAHIHRHDVIHVASGMDILLALGVNWIRTDKQAAEEKAFVSALT